MENKKKIKMLIMNQVKFMVNEEILYVPASDFVAVGQGDSIDTMSILVYMRREASGLKKEFKGYILVKKIDNEKFFYEFPENYFCHLNSSHGLEKENFYDPVTIDASDIAVLDSLVEETIKEEDEEFDLQKFQKFYDDIINYIYGPLFFLNKSYIDQKIIFLPEILAEYLRLFENNKDIHEYLNEWKMVKKIDQEEYEDGTRKNYRMKIYDVIINTIQKELHEDEEPESVLFEKEPKEVTISDKWKGVGKAALELALNNAIESNDHKTASEITEEINRREGNNGEWGILFPTFIFVVNIDINW